MEVTRETMKVITDELDERYVKIVDCNDRQRRVNKKFANDDKRIDLAVKEFESIKKLIWIIASTSIAQLIVAIFERIIG